MISSQEGGVVGGVSLKYVVSTEVNKGTCNEGETIITAGHEHQSIVISAPTFMLIHEKF